jgi:hypothetical protein
MMIEPAYHAYLPARPTGFRGAVRNDLVAYSHKVNKVWLCCAVKIALQGKTADTAPVGYRDAACRVSTITATVGAGLAPARRDDTLFTASVPILSGFWKSIISHQNSKIKITSK